MALGARFVPAPRWCCGGHPVDWRPGQAGATGMSGVGWLRSRLEGRVRWSVEVGSLLD